MNKSIRKIFSGIPRTYELINHVLTLGLDGYWRRKATRLAAKDGGLLWLDVCCGTAQTAVNLIRLADQTAKIVALDFCLPMLKEASAKQNTGKISFCLADAGKLPFPDETFDLVAISFATRNINTSRDALVKYFAEFRRIIKPGGRFVNLETSQPDSPLLRKLFHLYVRLIVMPVGGLISGSRSAYSYLSYTIPRFFNSQELSGIIYQAGFKSVSSLHLSFGMAAVHIAKKE